jgi:indole-3-glycerol phosphate synthase
MREMDDLHRRKLGMDVLIEVHDGAELDERCNCARR